MTRFLEETNFIVSNAAPFQDRMAEKLNIFIGDGSHFETHIKDILIEARDHIERNYKAFVGMSRKGQEFEYSFNKKADELHRMDKVLDVVLAVAKNTGGSY